MPCGRLAGGSRLARSLSILAVLVAVAALVAAALAIPIVPAKAPQRPTMASQTQDDAAAGRDAGDSPYEAMRITGGRRTFSANLSPAGIDADWYRLDVPGATCADAVASTGAAGQLTLASTPERDAATMRDTKPREETRLALAAPAGRGIYLGIEPAALRMSADDDTKETGGRYTFTIEAFRHADLPGEPGGDAGATLLTASPLVAGCSAGRLAEGDIADGYRFDVEKPRVLTVSFALASGDATARIESPAGTNVAVLRDGEVAEIFADEPGAWRLVVEAPAVPAAPVALLHGGIVARAYATSEYILGVTDGPGDHEPCRPSCR